MNGVETTSLFTNKMNVLENGDNRSSVISAHSLKRDRRTPVSEEEINPTNSAAGTNERLHRRLDQHQKYQRKTTSHNSSASTSKRASVNSTEDDDSHKHSGHRRNRDSSCSSSGGAPGGKRLMNLSRKYLQETFEGRRWNRFTLGTLPRRQRDRERELVASNSSLASSNSESSGKNSNTGEDADGKKERETRNRVECSSKECRDKHCQTSSLTNYTAVSLPAKQHPKTQVEKGSRHRSRKKNMSEEKDRVNQETLIAPDDGVYENVACDPPPPPVPPRTYCMVRSGNNREGVDGSSAQSAAPVVPPRLSSTSSSSSLQNRQLAINNTAVHEQPHSTRCESEERNNRREVVAAPATHLVRGRGVVRPRPLSSTEATVNSTTCKRHSQLMMTRMEDATRRQSHSHSCERRRRHSGSANSRCSLNCPATEQLQSALDPQNCNAHSRNFSFSPAVKTGSPSGAYHRSVSVAITDRELAAAPVEYARPVTTSGGNRLSRFFSRTRRAASSSRQKKAGASNNIQSQSKQQNYINFYHGQHAVQQSPLLSGVSHEILSAGEDAKQFALKRAALQKQLAAASSVPQKPLDCNARDRSMETLRQNGTEDELIRLARKKERSPSDPGERVLELEFGLSKTNPFYDQVLEEFYRNRNSIVVGADKPSIILPSSSSSAHQRRQVMQQKAASLTHAESADVAGHQSSSSVWFGRRLWSVLRLPFSRKNSPHKHDCSDATTFTAKQSCSNSSQSQQSFLDCTATDHQPQSASSATIRRPVSYASNASWEYLSNPNVSILRVNNNNNNSGSKPHVNPANKPTEECACCSGSQSSEDLCKTPTNMDLSVDLWPQQLKPQNTAPKPRHTQDADENNSLKAVSASAQLYETLNSTAGSTDVEPNATDRTHKVDGVYVRKSSLKNLKDVQKKPLSVKTSQDDQFSTFPLVKTSPKTSPDQCDVSNKLNSQAKVQHVMNRSGTNPHNSPTVSKNATPTGSNHSLSTPRLNNSSRRSRPLHKMNAVGDSEKDKGFVPPDIQPPSFAQSTITNDLSNPMRVNRTSGCNTGTSAPPSLAVTPNRPLSSSFKFGSAGGGDLSSSARSTHSSRESGLHLQKGGKERKHSMPSPEHSKGVLSVTSNSLSNSRIDDVPDSLPIGSKSPKCSLSSSPSRISAASGSATGLSVLAQHNSNKLDTILSEASCDEVDVGSSGESRAKGVSGSELMSSDSEGYRSECGWRDKRQMAKGEATDTDFERCFEDVVSEADCVSEAEFSTVDRTTLNGRCAPVASSFYHLLQQQHHNLRLGALNPLPFSLDETVEDQDEDDDEVKEGMDHRLIRGDLGEAVKIQGSFSDLKNKNQPRTFKDLRDVQGGQLWRVLGGNREAFTLEDKLRGYQRREPEEGGEGVAVRGVGEGGDSSSWGRGSVSSAISSVSTGSRFRQKTNTQGEGLQPEDDDEVDDEEEEEGDDVSESKVNLAQQISLFSSGGMLDAVDKRDVPVSPNSRHQTYVSNRASGMVETSSNGSGRTGQPFQQNEREDSDAISDNLYDSIEALHTNRHPAAKPSSNQQSFEPHANEAAAADVYSEVKRPLESEPCSPNAVQSLRPDRPMRSHGKSRSETVTMAAMIPLTIKDNSDHAFSDQSLENFTTQLHPSQNSRQWNNAHGQNENQSRLSTEDRHIYDEVTQEDSDDAKLKKSSDGNSGSGKGDNHDNSPEKATNVNNSTAGASGSNKLKKQKSFSKKWLTNRGSSHSHSASTASAVSNSSSQSAPGVAPHLDCGPASHHPASSSSNNYFGQPMDRLMKLEASCGSSSGEVPNFVIQCVQYLEQSGLESEGIYRQPGNQSEREKLLVKFEDSFCALFQHNKSRAGTQSPQQQHQSLQRHLRLVNTLDLPVDSVASALKLFFSKLPHPIIPSSQQETLMRSASVPSQYSIPHLCSLLKKSLPSHNYSTAAYLLRHLNKVASHSDVNKMTVENLATCFWPTLLRPIYTSLDAMSDSYRCRQLVEVLIRDCHALFDCDNQPDN